MLGRILKNLQDLNSAVIYDLAANTDSAEARPQGGLPDIPALGSFTLEQILRYHLCVNNVLGKHEVRERSLSDSTAILGILETTSRLLVMFNAAKATYFERECPQSGLERDLNRPGLVCLRNASITLETGVTLLGMRNKTLWR